MSYQKRVFVGYSLNPGTFMWTHEIGELDVTDAIEAMKTTLNGRSLNIVLSKTNRKNFYKVTFPEELVKNSACKLRKDVTVFYRSNQDNIQEDIDIGKFLVRPARQKTMEVTHNVSVSVYTKDGDRAYFIIGSFSEESLARRHVIKCMSVDDKERICKIRIGKWFSPNTCEVLDFPPEYYSNINGNLPSIDWNGIPVSADEPLEIDLTKVKIVQFNTVGHH